MKPPTPNYIMQNLGRYVAFDVYENIHKMLEYRGATEVPKMLSQTDFTNKLSASSYVTIDAETSRGKTFIVLVEPGSVYASKAPDFRKLAKIIPSWRADINVIFVLDVAPSSHVMKAANVMLEDNPNYYIEVLHYNNFLIVIPEHASVPRHELADANQVLGDLYMMPHNFQKIYDSDPPAIWIGARPGDFCRIHRLSDVVGVTIAYRYVVKNPNRL